MAGREVLVPDCHPWVPVPKELHHCPLRDAGHREGAGGVVPEIVERQPVETDPLR
jgi:hypothetical protein